MSIVFDKKSLKYSTKYGIIYPSGFSDVKGKIKNSLKSWAVIPSSPLKGGDSYGICIHNDVSAGAYHAGISHKKITPTPLK